MINREDPAAQVLDHEIEFQGFFDRVAALLDKPDTAFRE